MSRKKILVVEDDRIIAESIKSALNNMGYEVPFVVSAGEKAVIEAEKYNPDLVLMDIVLEREMDGIEAASQIRSQLNIPVVFLTAHSDKKILELAKIAEPFGYIIKPFEERELNSVIEIALYKHGTEKELKEIKEWLSTTLKSIGDAVIATDTKGSVTFMNPIAEKLTGWKQEEASGKPLKEVFNIIHEETGKVAEDPSARVIQEGKIFGLVNQTVLVAKDRTRHPIDDSCAPIKDDRGNIIGVVLIFRDITERRRAEAQIRTSLEEKEVLLKEIHHRVKNNMQVVYSLLNIQAENIKNKNVLNMLKKAQNRIRSMALIHEKLYQSKDLAKIEFGDYIRKLATGLFHSYGIDIESIRLKICVANIYLDIYTAIPCGLIINELVSNSLKHAFPDGIGEKGTSRKEGRINISMSLNSDNKLKLIVSDNGIGFPKDLDFRNTGSLGLQVVNTLVEQLEGSIKLRRHPATSFKIEFNP